MCSWLSFRFLGPDRAGEASAVHKGITGAHSSASQHFSGRARPGCRPGGSNICAHRVDNADYHAKPAGPALMHNHARAIRLRGDNTTRLQRVAVWELDVQCALQPVRTSTGGHTQRALAHANSQSLMPPFPPQNAHPLCQALTNPINITTYTQTIATCTTKTHTTTNSPTSL